MNTNLQRFSGEWETKRLGDIASIRNQKVLPANVNPNTPCVELDHIGSGDGQLLKSATAEYSTASKYRFFLGDVLFGRLRSYLRKFWLADRDGICTTEIWPLMVDPKQVDNTFLHAIVQSDQFFAMANISYGTHMPRTDWTVMRNFTVMLPPIQEQRAIAEALSDVDGLLNALEALIAKKQAIKQAVMQQLLTGKTRLPEFSRAWETKRLEEMGHCLRGVSYDPTTDLSSFDTDSTVRLLRSNNIQDAAVTAIDVQYVESRKVSESQVMLSDDILVCMANGSKELVGKAGLFRFNDGYIYTFGAFMGCFRVDVSVADPRFVFYLFQTHEYRNFISLILAGSSINNLKPSDIESAEFKIPDRNEQTAIASVLSDMDTEIAALAQRRDKTRVIKQGMMQQLLTGRVRLLKKE